VLFDYFNFKINSNFSLCTRLIVYKDKNDLHLCSCKILISSQFFGNKSSNFNFTEDENLCRRLSYLKKIIDGVDRFRVNCPECHVNHFRSWFSRFTTSFSFFLFALKKLLEMEREIGFTVERTTPFFRFFSRKSEIKRF